MANILPVIRIEPSARPLDQLAERAIVNPTVSSSVTDRAATPTGSSEMRREQGSEHAQSERMREPESQRKPRTQDVIAELNGENKRNKSSNTNADGADAKSGPGELTPKEMEILIREPPRLPPRPDTRLVVLREGLIDHITPRDIQELVIPHLLTPSQTALKGYEVASRDFLVASLDVKS